jgi:hypothetical protein
VQSEKLRLLSGSFVTVWLSVKKILFLSVSLVVPVSCMGLSQYSIFVVVLFI